VVVMKKIKLFRRGKLVGLVNKNFHKEEIDENLIWHDLELPSLFK